MAENDAPGGVRLGAGRPMEYCGNGTTEVFLTVDCFRYQLRGCGVEQ